MKTITVCDNCFQASCWLGMFMCDNSRESSTVEKIIEELEKLDLEHRDWWFKDIYW